MFLHILKLVYLFCFLGYSIMAPLIAEYDRHIDEMTQQLQKYQVNNSQIHFKTIVSTHIWNILIKSLEIL